MTPDILPGRKLSGIVAGLLHAPAGTFETVPLPELVLSYEGIPGDRHAGLVRPSNAREPWYPRGTEMRNERQVSILSVEDLAAIAAALGIDRVEPGWIGGNIVLSGIPHVSLLPPRTLLMFAGGVTVRIDGDNGPCRKSGAAIARNFPGRGDIAFGFVKQAEHLRGVVGWVERAGPIATGEAVHVRIWPQKLYPAAS